MADGFLLFAVIDVWRLILPLGLSLVLFGTFLIERWQSTSFNGGITALLLPLTVRAILFFFIISLLVGVLIPWSIGFVSPVSHLSSGPWSIEEMAAFLLAGIWLWVASKKRGRESLFSIGEAPVLLLFTGLLWVGRWDLMAHGQGLIGNFMLIDLLGGDWSRVIPKFFHLLFSSLATGGLVVVALGLYGWTTWGFREKIESIEASRIHTQTVRYGVGWTLSGLVPQMVMGPWLFLVLGEGSRNLLIDGLGLTSIIFFVSLTAYLFALVLLNATFMVPYVTGLAWGGLLSALITLVLMGVIRYAMFGAALYSHHIPVALDPVTISQVGWAVLVVGLLLWTLVRWCVWPLSVAPCRSPRLDK